MKRFPKKGYTRRRPSPTSRRKRAERREEMNRRYTSLLILQSSRPAFYRPCCATCGSRERRLLGTDGRVFLCARTLLSGPYGRRIIVDRHTVYDAVTDGAMTTISVRPLMRIV